MTWPTGPPPMPPSGWYDDPEHPWTWRYFDGAHWTDHRAPKWVPPARDPMSFSVWFDRSIAAVGRALRSVGALLAAVWLTFGVLGAGLAISSLDDDRGRELRRLLGVDQRTFGPLGTATEDDLTTAEADRAWELIQDIFWSVLPWAIVLGIAAIVASAWSVALVARVVLPVTDRDDTVDRPSEDRSGSAVAALRRVPAVLVSGLAVLVIFGVAWMFAALPVVVVVGAGGGGAAIVLTVFFAVLAVTVLTVWLWGRLAVAPVVAALGGHRLGVRRSWTLTHGRYWFVVGRLIVVGLIAGAVSGVVSVVNILGQFLGFAPYLAVIFIVQAIAIVASTIVNVCGQVVLIDQIEPIEPIEPIQSVR